MKLCFLLYSTFLNQCVLSEEQKKGRNHIRRMMEYVRRKLVMSLVTIRTDEFG